MRMLITGSQSALGAALVAAFAQGHDVRTADLDGRGDGDSPTFVGDLRDRDFAARAVGDRDVVIQLGPLARPDASPIEVIDAATRGTYNLITTASAASRFILVSSLRTFERYPMDWWVTEQWAPRPTTEIDDLATYLTEITVREVARVAPLKAIALRLGEVVDNARVGEGTPDPRWLHIEDAVQAVERAVSFEPADDEPRTGWWVFHIPGGGRRPCFPLALAGQAPFGYAPRHPVTDGASHLPPRADEKPPRPAGEPTGAARRVVIYGAGGPLAAITAEALVRDHTLRLTDVRPLAELVAEGAQQSPGAPMPRLLDPPHETMVVDVTDFASVLDAARDMDAIVNCTVVRPHPVEAFRVNTLGAYNVMRAAVECGIRRVVQTGPQQVTLPYPAGYLYDFDLSADVPQRPGTNLYILTKFLGQEICRIFAEEHGLEVPTLLFSAFINPDYPSPFPMGSFPFSVSWEDSGEAMRLALRAPSFPRPFEIFHIVADLPHGKYSNEKAKRLLGWQPRDRLEAHWLRSFD
jgi:nucleoside-diphosphate-sugar epimerase